jgi:hypothetical protein
LFAGCCGDPGCWRPRAVARNPATPIMMTANMKIFFVDKICTSEGECPEQIVQNS